MVFFANTHKAWHCTDPTNQGREVLDLIRKFQSGSKVVAKDRLQQITDALSKKDPATWSGCLTTVDGQLDGQAFTPDFKRFFLNEPLYIGE